MIHYFDKPGKENTAKTVELAIQAAKDHGISTIVVATGSGETPLLFRDAAKEGIHVVAVTRANGFKTPGVQDMPQQAGSSWKRPASISSPPPMCSPVRNVAFPANSPASIRWRSWPTPCACLARAPKSVWNVP